MIFVHKIKNKKENLKKSSFLKHPNVSVCDGVCACLKKGVGYAACV